MVSLCLCCVPLVCYQSCPLLLCHWDHLPFSETGAHRQSRVLIIRFVIAIDLLNMADIVANQSSQEATAVKNVITAWVSIRIEY